MRMSRSLGRRGHRFRFVLATALVGLLLSDRGFATVFHTRDEALKLAFPEAERTEARDFFLTREQRSEIERRAASPLESDLITVYVGSRGGETLGYAFLDTHIVRTLPETFLVVLGTDGTVRSTYVLAFYEPQEYLPTDRWRRQFDGKRGTDDLQVGRGIAAITGSTLSSRAIAASVRRALALHAVLIGAGPSAGG